MKLKKSYNNEIKSIAAQPKHSKVVNIIIDYQIEKTKNSKKKKKTFWNGSAIFIDYKLIFITKYINKNQSLCHLKLSL